MSKRRTVRFSDSLAEKMEEMSEVLNRSESGIIRDALALYYYVFNHKDETLAMVMVKDGEIEKEIIVLQGDK